MDHKIILLLVISIFLLASIVVIARPPNFQAVDVNPSQGHATVTIPSTAVEVAPGIFSLGTVLHKGKVVEGFMIIDYKKGYTHKPQHNPGGNTGRTTCFAFLAKGAKWKTLEPWVVNPNNTEGLDNDFVFNNLGADIQKWEDASSTNILGDGSTTADILVADTSIPDNVNEVYFGDVDSAGAIAVTIVWGIFFGPPSQRELVEWDQVYDQVDFDWSSTGEADKMDFENIATHELGHSVGMGHPPDECTEETMYRFASFGETKKRTLNTGDIAGIDQLY